MATDSPDFQPKRPLLTAFLWALIASVAAFVVAHEFKDAELKRAVYAGAATLLFGGVLGGLLKVLLDEVVAAKRRREDAAEFVVRVLSDLKGVYDRVGRAQILIPAHKSVKTYGDEVRSMIEARVQLRNVTRALERGADAMIGDTRKRVIHCVNQMKQYLDSLTTEFRENYKDLSDKQRGYEERAAWMLKRYAEVDTEEEPPQLPQFVWARLSALPTLADFIVAGPKYESGFEKPLDDGSELLRKEHARILRAHSGTWALGSM